MITYEQIKADGAIRTYITKADESLAALGYTEHSFAHVTKVAETAGYILTELGYGEHEAELVKIAGFLHDIGNLVNRIEHSQSGAVMAFRLLDHMDMSPEDIATVVTAIGNHDEGTGVPINPIAAVAAIRCQSFGSFTRKYVTSSVKNRHGRNQKSSPSSRRVNSLLNTESGERRSTQ